jgi:hypothetical protein
VQRKLIIRLRRSTTLLCHPELEKAELEEAFSGGSFLFGGCCKRATPFPLWPYEFSILCTTEIPFAHCSQKYS